MRLASVVSVRVFGAQLPDEVRDRLAGLLSEDALEEGSRGPGPGGRPCPLEAARDRPEALTGPGGLLSQLAGRVIEATLDAELAGHLGLPAPSDPARGQPNLERRALSEPRSLGAER